MQPCHNFCSTLATSALALTSLPGLNPPKTWFRGLARPTQVREGGRRCRQTSPKPAEDLPRRTWPRSEDQEDLDRRRIVSGSQVEPCRPQRRQWPCIYPSPRGLLRLLSHARGPCTFLHDFFAKKRAHGSVQPMLRFVINTPARLQLFSLPTGGPPGWFLHAGGTTTNWLAHSVQRETRPRRRQREHLGFWDDISNHFSSEHVPILAALLFARRGLSSRSFRGLSQPRPCSVLTAIGSPRSPKQIRGRLWEAPREQL